MIETRLFASGGFSGHNHEVAAASPSFSFTYTAGVCSDCGCECNSQMVGCDADGEGHARCWECHRAAERDSGAEQPPSAHLEGR